MTWRCGASGPGRRGWPGPRCRRRPRPRRSAPTRSPRTSSLFSSSGATTRLSRAKNDRGTCFTRTGVGPSARRAREGLAAGASYGDRARPPPRRGAAGDRHAGLEQGGGLARRGAGGRRPARPAATPPSMRLAGRARRRRRGRRGTACPGRRGARPGRWRPASGRRPRPAMRVGVEAWRVAQQPGHGAEGRAPTWSTASNSGSLSSWRSRL